MEKKYCAGTRTSPLALKQVEEVVSQLVKFYPDLQIEVKGIDTYGDKDRQTSIERIEETDFFTREIDRALSRGEIDFAVHSAKDLPAKLPQGFTVAAITASVDPDDVLVSKSGKGLAELPAGTRIGTSSRRRKSQLNKYRPDFCLVDIRGNIEERLGLVDEAKDVDAILIAAAGLVRLGLEERITQRLPFEVVLPHPLQGSLAVVARSENKELIDLLRRLR